MKKIAIIGGGNLGTAIAEGLLASKFIKAKDLIITRRNPNALTALKEAGVKVTSDNMAAIQQSQTIIFAVKPYQVPDLLKSISTAFTSKHLLISVVTGVEIKTFKEVIKSKTSIIRAMPNTAIAIRESMTCISGRDATATQLKFTQDLFEKLGKVVIIDETLMEAATALGACGTAYAMRYIRANIQAGIEIGFSSVVASLIAAQTVKGAAELLLTRDTHPEAEIDKVTTPKGCTIAGLNEMEHQGFSSSLIRGVVASYKMIAKN
ncbi:MAG: pyrroline-5-carboxylate reductase [Saprospiraceae bacterium]